MVNTRKIIGSYGKNPQALTSGISLNTKKFLREYTDQVISLKSFDGNNLERAPGPGLKLQAPSFKLHDS